MMTRFADASIRLKLIFAMALVTVLALLLSAVALGAYEVVTFRRALEQKLTIIADIVGRNCQAALAFGTPKDAGELLAALEAEPAVEIAAIYDRTGRLFASYNAPGHARLTAPSTPAPTGVRFEGGALMVARPIVLDGDLLGTVYIRSGLDELAERMRRLGLVVLAILTGCGVLAFVVSARLQRWIAAPILDLAHTARLVTSERNFALRATPAGGDEVGALVEDFNRMLVEIEHQDQRLRANQEDLEFQVANRTSELVASNGQLIASVRRAERHAGQIAQLTDLGQFLQSCQSAEEIFGVVQRGLQRLFPADSGGLAVLRASGNLLETMATWGPTAPRQRVFGPGECWAFRRGRPHLVEERDSPLRCAHLVPEDGAVSICVPMMAQGDNLGILQFNFSSVDDQEPAEENRLESTRARLAVALAEHIGLALANLRLREALRNQSIVDPLTGLFNRRYLEQTLERECRRAVRADRPLSVIMLDVDHFKRFNDAWGHEGGDAVLKELAGLLRRTFRGEDVSCRYGGEEFVVVLADASLAVGQERAEQLRRQVGELSVRLRGEAMGAITVSLGLAALPEHGVTPDALLAAADSALYEAKRAGRDRVMCAPVDPEAALNALPVS
jgi:diguanylate cyclase (GGDEF)-like protein